MDRKYQEVYREGVCSLEAADIEEARLDARLLLEYVCHTTRQDLLVHGDLLITKQEYAEYHELIAKRGRHIPLQHLTGLTEFMGLAFEVNEHVLIPRQDTEILVEEILRRGEDNLRILDMCTGSGCILLSLLHYSNKSSGVGVDVSQEALLVAARNAERLGIEDATFLQSDLFAGVERQEKYDVIVSNPPYIESGVIPTLMEEVRAHEPLQALDGGEDGLFFYRQITREAAGYLKRGGTLFYEIGYQQAQAVSGLMAEQGYCAIEVVKDYAGLDRVVYGTFAG